jgi:hypothetical protein
MSSIPEAIRWEPTYSIPELPLAAFDLTWNADGVLTCVGIYADHFPEAPEGVRLRFTGVHAFMSFDLHSDILVTMGIAVPALAQPVPYGGCWPFAELVGSPWTVEVTGRDGTIEPAKFRHWLILSQDATLHVMAHLNCTPEFVEWISRS